MTGQLSRAAAEDFLFHEADLLERWRLDDWHGLFLADGRYEIPALDDPGGDPRTTQFFVADDAELLAARITRLKSRNAHAENPPSRTHRLVSNVTVADGPDGLRIAWLESAAERIPRETLLRMPRGGIPLEDLTGALKGTRFEGAAQACSWVLAETGNLFLDNSHDEGSFDGFCDPWEDEVIAEGTEEWRKASALMDSVSRLTDWLEEDLPGRFADMLDFVLERLPEQDQQEQEDNDDE